MELEGAGGECEASEEEEREPAQGRDLVPEGRRAGRGSLR